MNKSQLRKHFRKIARQNIQSSNFDNTKGLNEQLSILLRKLQQDKLLENSLIASYLALSKKQIQPPHIQGYTYAYPRFEKITTPNQIPLMEFKVITDFSICDEQIYGIKIPPKHLETVFPALTLVPLTCFNPISKQRIGKGGGYYDNYIRQIREAKIKSLFIGIASSFLQTHETFWAKHDQPLDYIITEKNIY